MSSTPREPNSCHSSARNDLIRRDLHRSGNNRPHVEKGKPRKGDGAGGPTSQHYVRDELSSNTTTCNGGPNNQMNGSWAVPCTKMRERYSAQGGREIERDYSSVQMPLYTSNPSFTDTKISIFAPNHKYPRMMSRTWILTMSVRVRISSKGIQLHALVPRNL